MERTDRATARRARHEIIDREAPFGLDELFFSTTDRKGVILAGNEVFVRIAGFSYDEMIGSPHNIIRHPHMPKVVFRLLWQTIEAGEAIAAYVKNRAKDGSYYWVLATVRPIDGGYLSVRLKPSSPWFRAVEGFYEELLALEQRIERTGGTRTEAMDAAQARLGEMLAGAGFAGYGDFMRVALVDEVVSRRALIGTTASRRTVVAGGASGHDPLRQARDATRRLAHHLEAELDQIESYARLNQELEDRSAALVGLADEGKVLAINAVLAARRLGPDGSVLAKVAELMKQTFPVVADQSRRAVASVERTRRHLAQVGFAVALAVLQNDTAAAFVDELVAARDAGRHDDGAALRSAEMLAGCLRGDVENMRATLGAIADGLADIGRATAGLERNLDSLSAIERSGRIEATRTNRAGAFKTLFENTKARVALARDETAAMVEVASASESRVTSAEQLVLALDELDAALDSARLVVV